MQPRSLLQREALASTTMRVTKNVALWIQRFRTLPKPVRIKIAAGSAILATVLFTLVLVSGAQERPVVQPPPHNPSIGIPAQQTLVLDQPDYAPAPHTPNAPLLLKIDAVQPLPKGGFAYKLSYTGLEFGVFNLTDFLVTPGGGRLKEPVSTVTIESAIPADATYKAVYTQPPFQPRAFPYKLASILLALAWAGWGGLLFWPRGTTKQSVANESPDEEEPNAAPAFVAEPAMLADLLRPLVQKAANKSITSLEKARLESILFQYWGKELELDHLNSVEQLRRILEHPEGGALLRTVERWLYQPDSQISEEEIANALKDYLEIPSPEALPAAAPKGSAVPVSENVSTIPSS